MSKNRQPGWILGIMKNLNMVAILYITIIIAHSLNGYVHEGSAFRFLLRVKHVPLEPWKLPLLSVGLYICLLLLLSIHCENNLHLFLKTVIELGVVFSISYILNFSYTGIILLTIADAMSYFSDMKRRIAFMTIICAVYILLDYDLLSARYELISLETCLEYYRSDIQSILLGVRNILNSLNMFVFILYMVVLILTQLSEKERILSLNEKLNAANSELMQANQKLEEYARESEKAAETRERNRLAREIHDTLGHSLTGIITGIDACVMLMDIAPEATKEQLKAIADVARNGVKDVRRSVKALRPDALETLDLENALLRMIDETRRSTNVKIDYLCDTRLKDFSKDEEDVIYRIVQECITNAIRHGKANEIEIRIHRQYNMLSIYIKDNGIGCKEIKKGFGLHHMKERLEMLNGKLEYKGDDGFMVNASIPIRWGVEEEND